MPRPLVLNSNKLKENKALSYKTILLTNILLPQGLARITIIVYPQTRAGRKLGRIQKPMTFVFKCALPQKVFIWLPVIQMSSNGAWGDRYTQVSLYKCPLHLSDLREAWGHLAFDIFPDKEHALEVEKQEPRASHWDTTLSKGCSVPNPTPY